MTADEHALLLAIHAAPVDDLPRLVYADFLDDTGQPHRASFIRLQCDWHQALVDPAHEQYRIHLYNRMHDEVWANGDPGPPDFGGAVGWAEYRRGLPTEAVILANELTSPIADVFLLAPLLRVELQDPSPEQLEALTELPRETSAGLGSVLLVRPSFPSGLYNRLRQRLGSAMTVRPA